MVSLRRGLHRLTVCLLALLIFACSLLISLQPTNSPRATTTATTTSAPLSGVVAPVFTSRLFPVESQRTTSEHVAKNPHPFHFTIVEKEICSARRDLFIIAVVHSAPANGKMRMHIRETWASRRYYGLVKTVVVFALGAVKDARLQTAVLRESNTYRDIIQEDFIDSYRNLSYKGVMWLKWVSEYCPGAQYVLKTDDDIFVNIFTLANHMSRLSKTAEYGRKTIFCLVWSRMKVLRDAKSKWYVSEKEYAGEFFTKYCSGSAFLLTMDAVGPMYRASFDTPFVWVDDFFLTGAIPLKMNENLAEVDRLKYSSVSSLYVFKGDELRARLVQGYAVFGHVRTMDERKRLWKEILEMRRRR